MPLTVPAGSGLQLIAQTVVTAAPVDFVNFDGLSINADLAYRLEYEIILTSFTANQEISALTQNDPATSRAPASKKMVVCSGSSTPACRTNAHLILFFTTAYAGITGVFTWRRFNVATSRPVGFAMQATQLATGNPSQLGYGGFTYGTLVADVTDVGVVTSVPFTGAAGQSIIDIGSTFRLYKGAG